MSSFKEKEMENPVNALLDISSSNCLFHMYDKVMVLKIFIDSDDSHFKINYIDNVVNHNRKIYDNPTSIDAGFDLLTPTKTSFVSTNINKLDLNIICSAKIYTNKGNGYNTGYYIHPRSSLSKTPLRLANTTGIIDSGYRGHLIGMFDVVKETEFVGQKYDRFLQICAPGLVPILVEIVDNIKGLGGETARGTGGFGSTGR